MSRLNTFSDESVRRIAREIFREERELMGLRRGGNAFPTLQGVGGFPANTAKQSLGGVEFVNASGEEIPAHAVMRVTGAELKAGLPIITVAKPNTTFQRLYLVNGPLRVGSESTARGIGTWLSDANFVLYDSGTPAVGESWGPKNGQWSLAKWRYGFTIAGAVDSAGLKVMATQAEVNGFIGKTDASHAKGATGTISIYDGNNADTSDNMTGVLNKFAAVATTKWVDVSWRGGQWILTAAEC